MSPLEPIIAQARARPKAWAKGQGVDGVSVIHYGAIDIDPKHLVLWVCTMTDGEKAILTAGNPSRPGKRALRAAGYPATAVEQVHIGVESEETVRRESDGNWWQHFK